MKELINFRVMPQGYGKASKEVRDYITNLQQEIEQYENPDDMTLFYMWLDAKAKDKIKELQRELKEVYDKLIDKDRQIEELTNN